ncbi:uncharacterized protein LOC114327558 [Diabrotica virgifera virgifera]|uniref:THAP-type domain-containing protein n=1 Tax=Diabrotica virgifera virgifera TaxID=50390 RepID=A0ABM5IG67_DIAVI|nr:uncharacterized protein LOC114327558 [Diabrotica virgifera virgifera]
MPYNCCVPQCNSVSNKTENVKFHKFPSNKDLQKRWLIAIRSGKRISKHTKICSRHFSDENYTVTSLGQWRILKKDVVPSLNLPKRKLDTQVKDSGRSRKRLCTTVLPLNKNNEQAETDIVQTENELVQSDTQKYGSETPSTENPSVSSKTSIKTQTVITLNRCQLIAYEFLSEEQLKHFTGFSRKLFRFFVEEFGKSYIKVHSALSVENELLITLMKYRLNMYYSTLQNFFSVDIRTVRKIFVKWTRHLFTCFKKINFWDISTTSEDQYKIILDCTEIPIERSTDPIIQQATYSTYCGTNTFKILIACSEKGEIIYVSDVYGGCISDRKITAECGILELIQEGEFVLADRGFDISDLLEEKGVHLNIPPFKKGAQLSEEDIIKTRAIANRRIIVENVIGLAKKT